MLAYKGFTKELTATLGKGVFKFEVGKTYTEDECKTARNGFHCCENPFECLTYYPLGGKNRFFLVDAAGNIDEDEQERIACTEMTLLKELTLKEFAGHGMMYMVKHPQRGNWKQMRAHCTVEADQADSDHENDIAIARGKKPLVRGVIGSILGLLREYNGEIFAARLIEIDGIQYQPHKWYTVDEDGAVVACDEEVAV